MKIAITTSGHDLDAPIDPRFGRARRFLLVDQERHEVTIVENQQNRGLAQGAGIQAAQQVVDAGATALLTGHCGPKAFAVLRAAGVAVHAGAAGSAREALDALLAGEIPAADAADVDGHW
jgi:predicted Fe-Mo cluster-binding NifX family protein